MRRPQTSQVAKGCLPARERRGGGALPIMTYSGGTARKRYIFLGSGMSKGIGNSRIEVYERVGISIISALKRRAFYGRVPFFNRKVRLSKKSFVGFHMVRDLSRLRRSRSAASRPKKARSARQEVDL